MNGIESDITQYQYRFYKGDEEQVPDTLIESSEKIAPAFRGISYIVFEAFPLADFGNKIPYFEFKVTRKSKNSICDLINYYSFKAE